LRSPRQQGDELEQAVAFPATLVPELREHLDAYAEEVSTALVFTGPRGGVPRRGNFRRDSGWADAVAALGIPGLHFHDLRHTGNTLAAQAGVRLADLKARMGHDSVRAVMIYQHAAAEADQKIANALDQRIGTIQPGRVTGSNDANGTRGERGMTPADVSAGGAKGTRTPDPLLAKQVLFQLSYSPRKPQVTRLIGDLSSHRQPGVPRDRQPIRIAPGQRADN